MQHLPKSVQTKSRRYCSVPQCSSYATKEVSLHSFPFRDLKLCKLWKIVLKIGKPISRYMLVCSKHFLPEDFMIITPHTKLRRLKKNAVPSQNIPKGSQDIERKTINHNQRICRRSKEESRPADTISSNVSDLLMSGNREILISSLLEPLENMQEKHSISSLTQKVKPTLPLYEDKSTQTDFCDFFQLPQILKTDEKLMAFTGVDHATLSAYEKCVQKTVDDNGYNIGENLQLKLLLVLCKLKLNISFICLSILFSVSEKTCTRYIYLVIPLLAASLKPAIYWPSKEEILQNLPKCFQKFKNTRVVLDCTEIKIQRSKCLKCRILSYSNYKGNHTVKYLIGVAPSGLITYVSPGYGGRSTDKAIFNQENFIAKLNPYDAVMVDKGILIEKECEENYVTLIRPPFLKSQKQFSKTDCERTANIARARVHVERAIQRLKTFNIIHNTVDWYLLPYVDDILTIIAVTVNLQKPILADNKFEECTCDQQGN